MKPTRTELHQILKDYSLDELEKFTPELTFYLPIDGEVRLIVNVRQGQETNIPDNLKFGSWEIPLEIITLLNVFKLQEKDLEEAHVALRRSEHFARACELDPNFGKK